MVFNAFICNYFLFRCNFASANTVRSVMNWNSVTAVAGQSAEHGSRQQIIAAYFGGLSATANVTLPGAMRDVQHDGCSGLVLVGAVQTAEGMGGLPQRIYLGAHD